MKDGENKGKWIMIGISASSLVIVCIVISMSLSQGERVEVQTLQVACAPDHAESYVVQVKYRASSHPVGDMERHEISDVSLIVTRHQLGYQRYSQVYQKQFTKKWEYKGSTVLPIWSAKYVPHTGFVLPSARLFWDDDVLRMVLFDGTTCELFVFDRKEDRFVSSPKNLVPEKFLRRWYSTSFAPEDVYWSFALTHCATFFGMKVDTLSKEGFLTNEDLHKQWKTASPADKDSK